MATADLYIRVSTDEQAIRGYSQHSQEDRLVAYCRSFGIEIQQTIFEDHSAKNFNRPAWSKMTQRWQRSIKERPNRLLFTRWDRFSRNITDAFVMIGKLRNWGIEPQAIDQPLDLSVPENLMVLAMYLAVSEVENARRALNVKQGMHKALEEGRWVRRAPYGYINAITPEGEKCIIPKEPEATWVRKVFELLAEKDIPVSHAHKLSQEWGMQCSSKHIYNLLRNPVYCGKISVPAFERRKAYITKGKHKAIVKKSVFEKVQKVLQNRSNRYYVERPKDRLPLRGFIHCPVCYKKLTGSGSRGNTKRYFYYHCRSSCHYRIRADHLNQYFLDSLQTLSPKPVYTKVLEQIAEEQFLSTQHKHTLEHERISKSIEDLIRRSIKAKDLLHRGEVEAEDYLLIKSDSEKRIKALGRELRALARMEIKTKNKAKRIARTLSHLSKFYHKVDFYARQKLISLILKEKAILIPGSFKKAICPAAKIIFNLNSKSGKSVSFVTSAEDDFSDPHYRKIWLAEKEHGRLLNLEQVIQLMAFLRNLYRLTTL